MSPRRRRRHHWQLAARLTVDGGPLVGAEVTFFVTRRKSHGEVLGVRVGSAETNADGWATLSVSGGPRDLPAFSGERVEGYRLGSSPSPRLTECSTAIPKPRLTSPFRVRGLVVVPSLMPSLNRRCLMVSEAWPQHLLPGAGYQGDDNQHHEQHGDDRHRDLEGAVRPLSGHLASGPVDQYLPVLAGVDVAGDPYRQ